MAEFIEEIITNALTVNGNIAVTGTVDGRDVSVDGTVQDAHIAATSGVHGVTGNVVGTTDAQTLTNKTISYTNNTLDISTTNISAGTLGVVRGGTGAATLAVNSWLMGNGTSPIIAIKNNMSSAIAPAVTDDSVSGYAVGSRWFDTTANKEYVCMNASVGVAIWRVTTATTIQDEGVTMAQTPHTTLNFVGTGVNVTDIGGIATITIPGSSGATGSSVSAVGVATVATTSATYVDITNMTLSLTTGTKVFVATSIPVIISTTGNINIRITNIGASVVYGLGSYGQPAASHITTMSMNLVISGLTAGVNSFKVQWRTTAGTITSTVSATSNRYFSVITLN